jgi:hypothetical protein
MALLELNVPRARHLLTQAQIIADDKGLDRLARSISHEYDTLLRQLSQWEAIEAQEASITEVNELAGVEELLTRLVRQRAAEPPELHPEEPVLLLVLSESGFSILTKKFEFG